MRNLILALILWPSLALAEGLPKPTSDKVNDWAEVISPGVEAQLATTLADARRETGVHVVVVTMKDHANFGGAGQSIETYATNLFNAWGIGDRNRNDGVLILVTPGRRAMRIELGRGFGIDWDDTAKGIIDDTFLPAFAEGQIETGIRRGTDQVLTRIARPFAKGDGPGSVFDMVEPYLGYAGLCLLGVLFWFFSKALPWFGQPRLTPCPHCLRTGVSEVKVTSVAATEEHEGQGLTMIQCKFCDFAERTPFVIPASADRDSSSGRSGSGNFGGGRSSGGGASGRW